LIALRGERRKTIGLPLRFVVELVHCESCKAGHLKSALLAGLGQHVKRTEVGATPLAEDFVRIFRHKK
jgi:hypothetical protein